MKRIYDFSSFSKLYEAEGEKKVSDFQNLIQITVANILDCYNKQVLLAKDPDDAKKKITPDYDSVETAPGVDSLKKILDKVKSLAADDAKDPSDAWAKAGESFLGVLSKIYELLPNSKEDINKIIGEFMGQAKTGLQKAPGDNPAKSVIDKLIKIAQENSGGEKKLNASVEYFYDEIISEGSLDFLKGKKGKLKDISYQISLELGNLNSKKNQEDLKSVVNQQIDELGSIGEKVKELAGKKNSDIQDEEIEELRKRLAEVPEKIKAKETEIIQKNQATKEASPLFVKATQDLSIAAGKFAEYKTKKDVENENKKSEDEKKDSEAEEKVKKGKEDMGFKGTIKKDEVKDKKNDSVAEFQRIVRTKFEKKIKDSEEFKKFTTGKYAGDGYFGNNTEKVIKALKAGLGIKDDSSDITEELVDRVLSLKESRGFEFGRLKSFEEINEKFYKDVNFDVDKFLEVADGKKIEKKELPNRDAFKDKLKEMVEETYKNNKEAIDYILSKDFEPNEAGKKFFRNIFRSSWDNFSKYTDDQKKNAVSIGIRTTLLPVTGKDKITKDIVDFYLKPEGA